MSATPKRRLAARGQEVESLEARALLSAVAIETLTSDAPDTLDQAIDLGTFTVAEVAGKIDGNGMDVDWYAFTLSATSTVTFDCTAGEVSLYNDVAGNFTDSLGNIGQRLLGQASAAGPGIASMTRDLAAGTYYVAISGEGNSYFHPLLANSGIPGETGNYVLSINSTPLDTSSSTDPVVLAVDASPLGVRLNLSEALDFTPVVQMTTAGGASVTVASVRQILGGTELQIVPGAPLTPGDYSAVVKDAAGNVRLSFEVHISAAFGSENGNQGNDTPANSVNLGNIETQGLLQISGIIGDDPYYQFSRANPTLFAGNDVDLFRFHIGSTGAIGLQAEVFAGRIGSTLDAGLSLYRLDPATGLLVFVTGNNQTFNTTATTNRLFPLFADSVLMTGLTAGDYYLAVSQGWNTASTLELQSPVPGSGIHNPALAHSGSVGSNIGSYVLNVQVVTLGDPPQVVSASIADQSTLPSAPTELTVKFTQYMNLAGPALASYFEGEQSLLSGVFIRDSQGHSYNPRFTAFDPSTFEAHFVMADRIPAGNYELHLRGSLGVTNAFGRPLVGNSANGDYVVRFSVSATAVGTNGNPLVWTHDPSTDATGAPQVLGALFPTETRSAVKIVRSSHPGTHSAGDTADDYQFQILQTQPYVFQLSGNHLTSGASLELFDAAGNPVATSSLNGSTTLIAHLRTGTYRVRITGWPSSVPSGINYQLSIHTPAQSDNAPPLFSGPAASVGSRLAGTANTTPGGVIPGTGSSGVGGGTSNSGSSGSAGNISSGIEASGASGTRPSLLSTRLGVSPLNLTPGAGNTAIAIPAVTTQTGGVSSFTLRATRLARQEEINRDLLSPNDLSEFADGPVGRPNRNDLNRNESLVSGRKLQALIQSALAAKQDDDSLKSKVANDSRVPSKPDVKQQAEAPVDPQAVTAEEEEIDPNVSEVPPPEKFEQNASLLLEAISVSLNAGSPDRKTGESVTSTDKVFAAGLGLLLSELGLPRVTNPQAVRSTPGARTRTSSRRRAHQQSGRMEDSAS